MNSDKKQIIKINAITVPAEHGEEVAHRFASRIGSVDAQDGFEGFELLRPTDDRATWLVVSRWRDQAAFDAWLTSPSFAHGHRGVSGAGHPGAQTAAARGLSKSATEYAANNPNFKLAADHFVTLEGFVEKQFDDKHLESGDYNDVDVPGRQTHADAFKTGIK